MTIVNNRSGGPVGGECERTRSLSYQREEFQKNMVKSEAFCHMAIHSFMSAVKEEIKLSKCGSRSRLVF